MKHKLDLNCNNFKIVFKLNLLIKDLIKLVLKIYI